MKKFSEIFIVFNFSFYFFFFYEESCLLNTCEWLQVRFPWPPGIFKKKKKISASTSVWALYLLIDFL